MNKEIKHMIDEIITLDKMTIIRLVDSIKTLNFVKSKSLFLAGKYNSQKKFEISKEYKDLYDRAIDLLHKYENCNIANQDELISYYKQENELYFEFKILNNKYKKRL